MGKNLTDIIRVKALDLGFDLIGIARSRSLVERETPLKEWCNEGMNDKMSYLERNQEIRLDPSLLFPGAKSLVVTGLSYYSEIEQKNEGVPVLSRYTYGKDYHEVISHKLNILLDHLKTADGSIEGRSFVDSGPLHEKAWAQEAGLGWQGRHSIVINNRIGSFFFIGTLILNIELDYDEPFKHDHCGDCRLCITACPTGAINSNRTIDARKCIANLTIENRGPIPEGIIPHLGGRVYGCDRCQEVCPWNIKANSKRTPEFKINSEIAEMTSEEWETLTEEEFNRLFGETALKRIKYEQFLRNIRAAIGSASGK